MKAHLALLSLISALMLSSAVAAPRFPGAGSNYGGILEADSAGDPNNSGILTVVMNDNGAASLVLVWQGQKYRLKGVFTGDSSAGQLNKFGIPKKTPQVEGAKLDLFCNLDPLGRSITGFLSDPEASSGGGFTLDGNPADPQLTEQLPPGLQVAFIDDAVASDSSQTAPVPPNTGAAFAVVSIGRTSRRNNRTVGRLADDQPYAAGSPLRSRRYALRSGLYPASAGQPAGGQLLGNGDLSTTAAPESPTAAAPRNLAALVAALRWHKRPNLAATAYRNGFDGRVTLNPSYYTRHGDIRFVLTGEHTNFSNASLLISGANLPGAVSVKMNLTIFGAIITGPNPNRVVLRVQPLVARFYGSFRPDPASRERVSFHGAFKSATGIQPNITPGEGRGTFLQRDRNDPDRSQSGKVLIPQPK